MMTSSMSNAKYGPWVPIAKDWALGEVDDFTNELLDDWDENEEPFELERGYEK